MNLNKKTIALLLAAVTGLGSAGMVLSGDSIGVREDSRSGFSAAPSGSPAAVPAVRYADIHLADYRTPRYAGGSHSASADEGREEGYEEGMGGGEEEYSTESLEGIDKVVMLQAALKFDAQQQQRVAAIEASLEAIMAVEVLAEHDGDIAISEQLRRHIGTTEVVLQELRSIESDWQSLLESLTPEQRERAQLLRIRL